MWSRRSSSRTRPRVHGASGARSSYSGESYFLVTTCRLPAPPQPRANLHSVYTPEEGPQTSGDGREFRPSEEAMTTTSRLRIGIAGLGRLGRRHGENLARRVPRAELIAACSPIEDELSWARQDLGVASLYADYHQLLAEARVDAVSLVTATAVHAEP